MSSCLQRIRRKTWRVRNSVPKMQTLKIKINQSRNLYYHICSKSDCYYSRFNGIESFRWVPKWWWATRYFAFRSAIIDKLKPVVKAERGERTKVKGFCNEPWCFCSSPFPLSIACFFQWNSSASAAASCIVGFAAVDARFGPLTVTIRLLKM